MTKHGPGSLGEILSGVAGGPDPCPACCRDELRWRVAPCCLAARAWDSRWPGNRRVWRVRVDRIHLLHWLLVSLTTGSRVVHIEGVMAAPVARAPGSLVFAAQIRGMANREQRNKDKMKMKQKQEKRSASNDSGQCPTRWLRCFTPPDHLLAELLADDSGFNLDKCKSSMEASTEKLKAHFAVRQPARNHPN